MKIIKLARKNLRRSWGCAKTISKLVNGESISNDLAQKLEATIISMKTWLEFTSYDRKWQKGSTLGMIMKAITSFS